METKEESAIRAVEIECWSFVEAESFWKDFFQETLNSIWRDGENLDMQVGRDGTLGGESRNKDSNGTDNVRNG